MKTSRKNKKHISNIAEKGFTLVELLIVVIILAILAAIVVPQFASTTDDARDSAADSTLAGMRSAIDLYYQQHEQCLSGRSHSCTCSVPVLVQRVMVWQRWCGATAADAFMEQLSLYTDVNGGTCSIGDDTVYRFGPYLKKPEIPSDPYNAVSALEVVADGDLAMGANAADPGGFKYDSQDRQNHYQSGS